MNKKRSYDVIQAVIATILFYGVASVMFGFYYGWLDDVQEVAMFSGFFLPQAQTDPHHNIFVSNILIWLYDLKPAVPWYGLFMHSCIFISTCIFIYLLIKRSNRSPSTIVPLLLIGSLIATHLLRIVVFFNFTYVSMLLMASAMSLYFHTQGKRLIFFSLSLIFIAISIRLEAALFSGFFVFLYECLERRKELSIKQFIILTALILLSSVAVTLVRQNPNNYDLQYVQKNEPALKSIQEAGNISTSSNLSIQDSMKIASVITWNNYDKYAIDDDFLEKISNPFYSFQTISTHSLKNRISELRRSLVSSERYTPDYSSYNWGWNILILLSSIVLACIIIYLMDVSPYIKIRNFIYVFVIIVASVLLVGSFVKLESRIIYPLLFVLGFWLTSKVLLLHKLQKHSMGIYLILALVLSTGCLQLIKSKKNAWLHASELALKRDVLNEINTNFKNKTILYDYHSIYLLHDTPFKQIVLNSDNNHTVAAHYWLAFFTTLQEYYKESCGSDRIDKIMKCYFENKDHVLMVSTDYNMQFLEEYLDILYNTNLNIVPSTSNNLSALGSIKHSFMWFPLNFNYYEFE